MSNNLNINSTGIISRFQLLFDFFPFHIKAIVLFSQILAVFFSLCIIFILFKSKFKDKFFRILLIIACSDLAYSSLILVLSFITLICYSENLICPLVFYYIMSLGFIVINEFISSSLSLFVILIEIFLTIQRISIMKNFKWVRKNKNINLILIFLFIISILIFTPKLFMYKINLSYFYKSKKPKLIHDVFATKFGDSNKASIILGISIFRITLITVILPVLNVIMFAIYKQYLKQKLKFPAQYQSKLLLYSIFLLLFL